MSFDSDAVVSFSVSSPAPRALSREGTQHQLERHGIDGQQTLGAWGGDSSPPSSSPPPQRSTDDRDGVGTATTSASPVTNHNRSSGAGVQQALSPTVRRSNSLSIPAAFQASPTPRGGARRNSPGVVTVEDVVTPYQFPLTSGITPTVSLPQQSPLGPLPSGVAPLPAFGRRTSLTVPTMFVNTATPSDASLGRNSSLCMDDLEDAGTLDVSPRHRQLQQQQQQSQQRSRQQRTAADGSSPLPPHYRNQQAGVTTAANHQGISLRGQRMRQSLWMHAGGGLHAGGGGLTTSATSMGEATPVGGALSPQHAFSPNRRSSGAGSHVVLPAIFLSDATPQNPPLASGAVAGGGPSAKRGWATPRLSAGDDMQQSLSQLTSSTAPFATVSTAVFGMASSGEVTETSGLTTRSPPNELSGAGAAGSGSRVVPPPAAERREHSGAALSVVVASVSPAEAERWSPSSGSGPRHHIGSLPPHSSDNPLYTGVDDSANRHVAPPPGLLNYIFAGRLKLHTTDSVKTFHRPWYHFLLAVTLIVMCGSLCSRMAITERHFFSFSSSSLDGLSRLADVRQTSTAPLLVDPVLGTSVALDHLRSRQQFLHTLRATALMQQRFGLTLLGRDVFDGVALNPIQSASTTCTADGSSAGLVNLTCESYARSTLTLPVVPLNATSMGVTSSHVVWNVSNSLCPPTAQCDDVVYSSKRLSVNFITNVATCSSTCTAPPATSVVVLPIQLASGVGEPNASSLLFRAGHSVASIPVADNVWSSTTLTESDYVKSRCLVYPSNLRIVASDDVTSPVPLQGLSFFRRQGALFLVEMLVWVTGLVLLASFANLFFSVQKVMHFVGVAMTCVVHVCRESLAEMKDVDPEELLQIKLAFCFKGVDIGTVNEYLLAVEAKHRDFRSYLPRGLMPRIIALTSNDGGSTRGGGRLGSAKGSSKALSPRGDMMGLQPLISPRGGMGATSPVNSFRGFGNMVGGSGQFSPRLEPVQNPFHVPPMNPNDPVVAFDVGHHNDSPTGLQQQPQQISMSNSGHRASGSGVMAPPSGGGGGGVGIQIRSISPPLIAFSGALSDYQNFRRRTQTDSGAGTRDQQFIYASEGHDDPEEDDAIPNLNEYEGMLVSFGLPGIATATVDRLAVSSRSASVLGGGPPSSVAQPLTARRTSEAFAASAFLSPLAANRVRRLSGQSALELSVSASPPQLLPHPPIIHVRGPESAPATGLEGSMAQSGTIEGSLRPDLQLDRSLPTPFNAHDQTASGITLPATHDEERSGSVFGDVIPLPPNSGIPGDAVHPFQLPSSPSNSRRISGNVNTASNSNINSNPFIPQFHVNAHRQSGSSRNQSGIAAGAVSPSERPTSPTLTHNTTELKRRSTNQHANTDLAEASRAPTNHMAHAGIRKVTFVVCQLSFGGGHNAASEYFPESSFGQRVQHNGQDMKKARLAAMEKCSDIFLQHAMAICDDFQGVAYRITMSSIVLTFNAFTPCPFHEARGCFAALHLAQELQEHLEELLEIQTASGGVRWGICVNSGAAVVGITGTQQKMAPSIVSDALTIAQTTVRLADIIRCHVLVLEPCYHVSRTQVFCVPVDIVGHDGAQIIVFELKGRQDDFRHLVCDYQPFMDGFACLAVHKFDEAESNLQQALAVDHNASRLLSMVQWCRRVQGTGAAPTLPKPYHRHLPLWDSPEILADQEELDDDVIERMQLLSASEDQMTYERPRLLSTLAESIFRGSDRNPSVDQSPFPWSSNRNSMDYNNSSRKSSNTASMSEASNQGHPPLPPVVNTGRTIPVEIVDRKNQTWWRSERLLGQGAFGAVYQGLTQNGALVAMKVLPVNSAEIRLYRSASTATMIPGQRPPLPPHLEEVLKEISLLSQLVHPNIVQYHTSTIMSNYLFIMMEFMSGGTLTRMVQMFGGLPETVVRRFCKDVLEGLKFLHSKQIVHRDINPNNVLLTLDGTCKISDFGAAASNLQRRGADAALRRRFSEETTRSSMSSGAGTPQYGSPPAGSLVPPQTPVRVPPTTAIAAPIGDGQVIGTPLFMAPEAARGNATTASDIWGFGVILCYCFSGTYPYPEQDYSTDVVGFLRRLGNDETYMPRIPREAIHNPAVLRVIEQCLQRREELRPTAADILMSPFLIL